MGADKYVYPLGKYCFCVFREAYLLAIQLWICRFVFLAEQAIVPLDFHAMGLES